MARRLVGLLGVVIAWLGAGSLAPAQASAAGTVSVAVQGQGSVTGDGINCTQSAGPDCSQAYADTTYQDCDPERKPPCITISESPYVELTAGPDSNGFSYDGFTGCDTVEARVCGLVVNEDSSVTARFRDAQAPAVSAPTPASGVQSGTFTISATASDNAGVTRVDFRNGLSLLASDTTAPYQFSWDSTTTSDGVKSLTATAVDAAGLSTTSASSTITVDNTAPALSLTSGPDGVTFGPGSTQTWTFSASDSTTAVSAECRVVGVTTPAFGACSGGSTSHAVSNLPEGSYVFEARAKDGAGHTSSIVQRAFSIDGTPPETTIEDGPKARTTKKKARFRFASSEANSTFECSLDGGGYEPCQADKAYNVKKGRHKLLVRATDAYGNTDGTPATWKWRRVSRG